MKIYIIWTLILLLQNASFTWVSRARNSGSDISHAIAAVFSNGIWFASTFIVIDQVTKIMESGTLWPHGVLLGLLYVSATVTGSVTAGHLLREHFEKGKRRVGYYKEKS